MPLRRLDVPGSSVGVGAGEVGDASDVAA